MFDTKNASSSESIAKAQQPVAAKKGAPVKLIVILAAALAVVVAAAAIVWFVVVPQFSKGGGDLQYNTILTKTDGYHLKVGGETGWQLLRFDPDNYANTTLLADFDFGTEAASGGGSGDGAEDSAEDDQPPMPLVLALYANSRAFSFSVLQTSVDDPESAADDTEMVSEDDPFYTVPQIVSLSNAKLDWYEPSGASGQTAITGAKGAQLADPLIQYKDADGGAAMSVVGSTDNAFIIQMPDYQLFSLSISNDATKATLQSLQIAIADGNFCYPLAVYDNALYYVEAPQTFFENFAVDSDSAYTVRRQAIDNGVVSGSSQVLSELGSFGVPQLISKVVEGKFVATTILADPDAQAKQTENADGANGADELTPTFNLICYDLAERKTTGLAMDGLPADSAPDYLDFNGSLTVLFYSEPTQTFVVGNAAAKQAIASPLTTTTNLATKLTLAGQNTGSSTGGTDEEESEEDAPYYGFDGGGLLGNNLIYWVDAYDDNGTEDETEDDIYVYDYYVQDITNTSAQPIPLPSWQERI